MLMEKRWKTEEHVKECTGGERNSSVGYMVVMVRWRERKENSAPRPLRGGHAE